jgi:hypothetical protein
MGTDDVSAEQQELCSRFNVKPFPAPRGTKVGISRSALDGELPINGLRHEPVGDTNGWYIWGGERLRSDPDFFSPMHVDHLDQACPAAVAYLALPPGYRFLVAVQYEDVWEDRSLLEPKG